MVQTAPADVVISTDVQAGQCARVKVLQIFESFVAETVDAAHIQLGEPGTTLYIRIKFVGLQ